MAASQLLASGVLYDERRDFHIKPQEFAELWPDATPFLSGLFNKGPRKTPDPDFKLFESRSRWRYQYVDVNEASPSAWSASGAPGGTAADIVIDNATGLTIDDSVLDAVVEIWNEALTDFKGYARISAVDLATQIDLVSLGHPESATFVTEALANNDRLFFLSNAREELTEAGEAAAKELEVVYNSVQRHETVLEITEDLANEARLRGASDELARQRTAASNEHKVKVERTLWRGMRTSGIGGVRYGVDSGTDSTFLNHLSGTNSSQIRTTMGFMPIARRYFRRTGDQQNYFARVKATYDLESLISDFEKVFQYNPTGGRKIGYAGPTAISFLSGVAFAAGSGFTLNHDVRSSSFGISISELLTPHGNLDLVKVPLFDAPYNNYLAVVDPMNVDLVNFTADKYMANVKTDNAYTGIKDVMRSQNGLGLTLSESHSLFILS